MPNRVRAVKVVPVTAEPDPAKVSVPYVPEGSESDESEPDPPQPDKRADAKTTAVTTEMIDFIMQAR
jgi:hypothetical protein